MVFISDVEKWIPGFGHFKPGDKVEFNDELFSTGLFKKDESVGEE